MWRILGNRTYSSCSAEISVACVMVSFFRLLKRFSLSVTSLRNDLWAVDSPVSITRFQNRTLFMATIFSTFLYSDRFKSVLKRKRRNASWWMWRNSWFQAHGCFWFAVNSSSWWWEQKYQKIASHRVYSSHTHIGRCCANEDVEWNVECEWQVAVLHNKLSSIISPNECPHLVTFTWYLLFRYFHLLSTGI